MRQPEERDLHEGEQDHHPARARCRGAGVSGLCVYDRDSQGHDERAKEEDKEVRAEKKKKKGMQISDEEALRLQQEMFAAAKARYNSRRDGWSWAASCRRQSGIIRLAK